MYHAEADDGVPCTSCRARKKRCFHSSDSLAVVDTNNAVLALPSQLRGASNDSTRESSPDIARAGDYVPQTVLENISSVGNTTASSQDPGLSPATVVSSSQHPQPVYLLKPAERDALAARVRKRRRVWYKTHRHEIGSPVLSEPYRSHLEDLGAFLVLPSSTVNALCAIYISMLDDLIPIVDGPALFRDATNGKASFLLIRAICLVTCKFPQAAPHLRLEAGGPVLSQRSFASKLLTGLDAAIRADLETVRLTKIRILALMHLHNDGPRGRERSSSYLASAIGEAWAMTLHQDNPDSPESPPDKAACDMLWWTLRNLDKLSKLIMGVAPFIVEDSDIGIERVVTTKNDNYRSSLMALSIVLGDLTAVATKVFKASSRAIADDTSPFPSFTEITAGTSFDHFLKSHQAYLELWYHLNAMMSCRHGPPGSITYNRRLESAERVISILGRKGHVDLPPLPLVPYVLSIATTVVFRALKDGQRTPQEALPNISYCCDALDELSQLWTSAKGIARLARHLFRHIESSHILQTPSKASQTNNLCSDTGAAPPSGIMNSFAALASGGAQIADQDQTQWSASAEVTQQVLLDMELGGGINDLNFDIFSDMSNAGFFDYLNSNYGENEGPGSLDSGNYISG